MNLGIALLDKGDLPGAFAAFEKAIRLGPRNPKARYNLGNALLDKGDAAGAVAAFREAIRLRPEYAIAYYNLGIALTVTGDVSGAVAAYEKAIRLRPEDATAYHNLGIALTATGDVSGAVAAYEKAIRLRPDFAEPHNNLGNALKVKGDFAGAVAAYEKAIRLRPDFADAYFNLGNALKAQGRFRPALTALRRGHELGSRNPRWSASSSDWIWETERMAALDERLPAVLEGKTCPKDGIEWVIFARLCQGHHRRYAAAVRFFEEAFAAEPKLAEDWKASHRYNAACAAALAGCGQGKDAESLGEKQRTRLRKLALDWLRADLKGWQKLLDQEPVKAGPVVAKQTQHWLADSDFAGVRGADALARLPEAERPDWRKLWQDVESLRRRVVVPAKPPDAGEQPKGKKGPPGKGTR